tara:strand:- start:668 stop:790 length:123 start_codon:yes stop_codon:yes gene_type:complete
MKKDRIIDLIAAICLVIFMYVICVVLFLYENEYLETINAV